MKLTHKYLTLSVCTLLGSGLVYLLFSWSENIIQYHNTFIRRFPQHLATPIKEVDLNYNSYYFAGSGNGKIYLGNVTAPMQILVIDTAFQKKEVFRIALKEKDLPFQSPQIKVNPPYFYLYEGTVPYVFRGSIHNWKGELQLQSGTYFSQVEPIDSLTLASRFIAPKTGENVLGTMNLKNDSEQFGNHLLQKQIDGVFDTDGSLHYNKDLKRLVYVYLYRNEFVVADRNLNLDYRGNTIDTISHAQLKLSKFSDGKIKTFSEPPLIVNKASSTSGNYLFVNSALPGQYESKDMWKKANIVDVYDLGKKSYLSSFYLYHDGDKKMRSFIVVGNSVFILMGNKLVRYRLREDIIQNSPKQN